MKQQVRIQFGFAALALLLSAAALEAQAIRVTAAVQQEIYTGEPFQYQIIIDGYEQPGKVDLGGLEDWSPRYAGGQNVSQTSISIINNQVSERKTLRYVMAYQFVAPQAGRLRIPSVIVEIEGTRYTTNPVAVNVLKPATTDKLGLEMSLSEDECYVGQPIEMTITWYVGANLGGYNFNIPALRETENFIVEEAQAPPGTGGELIKIEVEGGQVIARKENGVYKGNNCLVITFSKILIPRRPGVMQITAPGVICNVEVTSRDRSRSIFDDFFADDFFGRNREYRRFSSMAQGATLTVKPLPDEGRPVDFNGLVGRYSITTFASPVKVNVGDPITLTISIRGELLKLVEMPDLSSLSAMAQDFKIPADQSAPKIVGMHKVFTQTIRAAHDQVTEIPAIPLCYFDVDKGQYVTVHSEAIPLEVAPTKVVTADQALSAQIIPQASEIEAVRTGIAANYEGPGLWENTAFSPGAALIQPAYLALWWGPLLIFAGSGFIRLIRHNNPARQQARRRVRSCSRAVSRLKRLDSQSESARQAAADIMRRYVGDRFDQTARSLTARDCKEILSRNCRDLQTVERFCQALERCEQSRFAGGLTDNDTIKPREIAEVVKTLDKHIKT